MEDIKKELCELFDEMLPQVKNFNRGSYETVFQYYYNKYSHLVSDISTYSKQFTDSDRQRFLEELSKSIPEHAYQKISREQKLKKGQVELDYNTAMAVYVIPILTYTKDQDCKELATYITRAWNEKKFSKLQLGLSSYEQISGGFQNTILDIFKRFRK